MWRALTDDELALIRLLLPHEHTDQGGLARAIGADDADDAARGQREGEVLDEGAIAEALAYALGLHHLAQARAQAQVRARGSGSGLGTGSGSGLGLGLGLAAAAAAAAG